MNNWKILFGLLFFISFGQCGFDHKEYKDMTVGILKGLLIKDGEIPALLKCVSENSKVRFNIVKYMDIVKTLNFKNLPLLAEKLTDLIGYIKLIVVEMSHCTQEGDPTERLFNKIYTMMGTTINKRLMLNFISNPQQIFKDIRDAVISYGLEKYESMGVDLGDIIHIVITFTIDPPLIHIADYLDFLKGFFIGLNIEHDIDSILKCIDSVPKALERLAMLLQELKKVDLRNLLELLETFKKVIKEVRDIIKNLVDCSKSVPEIERLLKKILMIDIKKVIEVVMKNYLAIFENLMKARDAFLNKKYRYFGTVLGSLLYQLFLANEFLLTK